MDVTVILIAAFLCLRTATRGHTDMLVDDPERQLNISTRVSTLFRILSPPPCGTVGCGLPNIKQKIVGGHVTVKHEYPWMVGLHDSAGYLDRGAAVSQFCGGAIVSRYWVLTAAHCTLDFKNTPWMLLVSISRHDLSSFALFDSGILAPRIARKIVVHPRYNKRTTDNDVSLVKLFVAVSWTRTVRPVCFPSIDPDLSNQIGLVIGWGSTSEGGPASSFLLEVKVPLITNEVCQRKYASSRIMITPRMLCAAHPEGGKDSCQGDSGGPLTLQCDDRFLLIGVVSFGLGCANANHPGVYARVTSFRDWIYGYVGQTELCLHSCNDRSSKSKSEV